MCHQIDPLALRKIEAAIAHEAILHAKPWLQQKAKQLGEHH